VDGAWGYVGVSTSPSDRTRGALSFLNTLHLCLFHRVDGGLGERVTAWGGGGAVAAALGHALGGGRYFDASYRLAGAELMATSSSGGNRTVTGTVTGTDTGTGTGTGTAVRLPNGPIAWLLAARLAIQVAAVGTHLVSSLDAEWRRSYRETPHVQTQARARAQAMGSGDRSFSDTSTTRATRDVSPAFATATDTPGTATATTTSSSSSAPKCALCLGPRANPAVPRCGHVFCWDCIVQWAARRTADQPCHCPVCRAIILPQQIRLLRGFR
jgi:hypothetical protein